MFLQIWCKIGKRGNPNWDKGISGNPNGKPKGHKSFALQLLAAIKTVEQRDKKKLLEFAVRRAFESDRVLTALLSKLVPDLSQTDWGQETIKTFAAIIKKATSASGGGNV